MKVPDKIYIEQKAVMYDLVNIEPCKPDDYEYVSKDALIEILQGYSHPLAKLVMQEIIDKINSL